MAEQFMPTTDLDFNESSSDARHAAYVGVDKDFGRGLVAVVMLANGAVALGGLAGVTAEAGSAQALTNAIATALTASQRKGLDIGYCQATGGAATGEYFWAVKRKADGADTRAVALTENAVAVDAQATTTTSAGEIDDVGGAGTYDIEGMEITTAVGSGTTFSTWQARTPLQLNPTVN